MISKKGKFIEIRKENIKNKICENPERRWGMVIAYKKSKILKSLREACEFVECKLKYESKSFEEGKIDEEK